MKRLLNYIIILSLPLFVFGCDTILSSGKTIDMDSNEFKYIEESKKGITNYKGVPFNGFITETYSNGQLREKTTYKDGKWDGVYEGYYENGQLKAKLTYKDGKWDGVYESYYENGQLKAEITYKDGEQNRVFEEYNEDGTRK
jgi:antitoxin component YwqK of YwqJK toxin-antitoxin module